MTEPKREKSPDWAQRQRHSEFLILLRRIFAYGFILVGVWYAVSSLMKEQRLSLRQGKVIQISFALQMYAQDYDSFPISAYWTTATQPYLGSNRWLDDQPCRYVYDGVFSGKHSDKVVGGTALVWENPKTLEPGDEFVYFSPNEYDDSVFRYSIKDPFPPRLKSKRLP